MRVGHARSVYHRSLALSLIVGALPRLAQAQVVLAPATTSPGADITGPAEIVVTATRREESLQKVPVSVSVLGGDALTTKGIQAITDIAPGQVPGVIFQAFGGTVSSAEISIRGVGTNDPDQITRELPVPIYIDGVYLGRGQGAGLQLIDPERVEVLRGPQGTLFGRNAEGGAVQYVSRKPSGEFGADVTGSIGNYDDRRVRGTINLPDFHGFKVAFSGLYSDQDGFTKNRPAHALLTGEVQGIARDQSDFSARQASGARVAVRWDSVENLIVDYSYDWSRTADTQAYQTYTGPQIPGAEPPTTNFPDRSSMPFYTAPFITEASGHSLTAAWTVSDHVTLKSISSYRRVSKVGYANLGTPNNLGPAFGLSTAPQDAIYYIADQDTSQHQYSEEAQLLGSWNRLQLTAGAVYYAERGHQIFHTSFFSGPGLALLGLPDFRPGAPSATRVRSNSLGLYLQGTYTAPILDDKLQLTAGVRYADDDKKAVRYLGPGDALGITTIALDERADSSAKRADPAFTLQYNFSPRANVYFRYAQAYRAGGVSVRSISFLPYKPEVTKSFELGFKAQMADRRLTLNAALYQNKVYNPQFDVGESPLLSQTTITINAPVVRRVRGAELESTYRTPIPGLSLAVNLSFLRVHQPFFISPTGAPPGLVNALPLFTPKFTGSINVDYTRPVGFGAVTLHADYSHSSRFYVGGEINPADLQTPTDPITVRQLNARLTFDKLAIANGDLSFSLWVKNLLDRHDVLYAYHVPGDYVHSFNYLTDPRTFGLDVRYHF